MVYSVCLNILKENKYATSFSIKLNKKDIIDFNMSNDALMNGYGMYVHGQIISRAGISVIIDWLAYNWLIRADINWKTLI